jgi:hypothetical protein
MPSSGDAESCSPPCGNKPRLWCGGGNTNPAKAMMKLVVQMGFDFWHGSKNIENEVNLAKILVL